MVRAKRIAVEREPNGAVGVGRSGPRRTLAQAFRSWSETLRRSVRRVTSRASAASAKLDAIVDPELPIYRITCMRDDRWVVQRHGAPERAFRDPDAAEAFVRQDCGRFGCTLELHTGTLYLVARIDPRRPPLFGWTGSRSIELESTADRRSARR